MAVPFPVSRTILGSAVAAVLLLSACGKKEAPPVAPAPVAAKGPIDLLGPQVGPEIPPLAAQHSQFKCLIDPVNYQLDLGNMGRNAVVSLPKIGAQQIAADALLLDAASAEDASQRIMLAKPEYKRVPPKCEAYALSTRDAKLDQNTALTEYKTVNGGTELAYLYYAVSKAKPAYEVVAQQLFPEYGAEADTFKRQDLLKTIAPAIDGNIKSAEGKRLVMFEFEGKLKHYDAAKKQFPVELERFNIAPSTYVSWRKDRDNAPDTGSYHLTFDMGGRKDLNYEIPDESAARALEGELSQLAAAARSAYAPVAIRAYGQAVKAAEDGGNKVVMVRLVQIDVMDRDTLRQEGRQFKPLFSLNLR
ncbi:hypothetical protein [Pseudoduganella violaceinigra]|uniref:hypothetical protein n=1 Tax=Pseudoduganella violaceinigra TaxID=246602 RepID=UPI0004213D45|nr:hypothetical protein [Pseudoduganella violaceinigra]